MPGSGRCPNVAVVVAGVCGAAIVNEDGIETIQHRRRHGRCRHVRPQVKPLRETNVSSDLAAVSTITKHEQHTNIEELTVKTSLTRVQKNPAFFEKGQPSGFLFFFG